MMSTFTASHSIATARWMTPDRVEERFLQKTGGVWLGRNPYEDGNPVGLKDDRHIMLVAGSRAGKGVSSIIPNLCHWPGSMMVIDPKGENATITAARRGAGTHICKGLGQDVYVLDPMGVAKVDSRYRASFNPLDALDPDSDHVNDDAIRLADALIEVGQGESRQWDEGARSMIKTLILHVLTSSYYEGRRNLITVRSLIMRGEHELLAKHKQRLRDKGKDPESAPSAYVMLWRMASQNTAVHGVIAAAADSFLESAKNSPKQYNSYRMLAERATEFIESKRMQDCLSKSSFKLEELKTARKGATIYLSLPSRDMNTHYRWLRMMSTLALTQMEITPGQPASGHPVMFLLDEFAGMKRMDIIEHSVAQVAGFGVKMFFILQSLEQLKSVYPDRWETFLANCGVKVFFSTTDNFTNEYVSQMLGEREIVRETHGSSTSTTDTTSTTSTTGGGTAQQHTETDGTSSQKSQARGRNRGWTSGDSDGLSYGPSWFWAFRTGASRTRSSGRSGGRNWTKTDSEGSTHSTTEGNTQNDSWSRATATSHATGSTSSTNEQIFKKPLLTKDEMAQLFVRVDDPDHGAYPGLALVSVAGEAPIILRRTPYYADAAFVRCFDPHPDHPFVPYKAPKKVAPPPLPLPAKKPPTPVRKPVAPKVQIPTYVQPHETRNSNANFDDRLLFDRAKYIYVDKKYSNSARLPYSAKAIWAAITSEYWSWVEFWNTNMDDLKAEPLPSTFSDGFKIKLAGDFKASRYKARDCPIVIRSGSHLKFLEILTKNPSEYQDERRPHTITLSLAPGAGNSTQVTYAVTEHVMCYNSGLANSFLGKRKMENIKKEIQGRDTSREVKSILANINGIGDRAATFARKGL